VQNLIADLRHALRSLRSHLSFAVTAVLTLALGIGVTTTMYSIVDGIVLRPLPFPNADRLITICEQYPGATPDWCSIAPPNVEDIAARSHSIAAIGIGRSWPYHLATVDGAESVTGGIVTPELFQALGARPLLGRLFERSDLTGRESDVAILSYEMWQTRFGSARDVIGRRIVLDGKPVTIVGVLPRDFALPKFSSVKLWRTLHIEPRDEQHRGWPGFVAYGLLRPGVSLASARSELSGLAAQIRREHFASAPHWGLYMESLQDLVVGDVKPVLLFFLGAVSLILLIGCANVANLLLARSGERSRELALRAALGADRWRIVRGLLVESFLLALGGTILGVLLAQWGTAAFKSLAPVSTPRLSGVGVDGRVLVFALVLSVATTMLFGLAPAIRAARADLAGALRDGRGSNRRGGLAGRVLVAGELALAMVLVTGAGLLARSFAARASWNPGFERDHLIAFSIFAPGERYPTRALVAGLLRRVETELRAVPGIAGVGSASAGPLFGGGDGAQDVEYSNRAGPSKSPAAWYDMSPSYFATLGVPVVRGRALRETDDVDGQRVALVNETLAKKFWPNDAALGKQLTLFSGKMRVEIVGVVRDVPPATPGEPVQPQLYWSNRQEPRGYTYFLLRTSVDPASVMTAVRERLKSIDTSLRPANVNTMPELVAEELKTPRFQMLLLVTFGVAALGLAAVGTYGLFAYRVARRRREIGIRIALGALGRQVIASVLRDGLTLAAVGIVVGVGASFVAGRAMRGMVAGVSAFDPLTIGASCVLLVLVVIVACLGPARRASTVDPAVTLTAE
jgi:putative ABC transport system permease protein